MLLWYFLFCPLYYLFGLRQLSGIKNKLNFTIYYHLKKLIKYIGIYNYIILIYYNNVYTAAKLYYNLTLVSTVVFKAA